MTIEFHFTPELHLKDGRIIRDLNDAVSFAREQELRSGVDQRDEVLHRIEHAQSKEEAHAAVLTQGRCASRARVVMRESSQREGVGAGSW